jgi:hypothetical protein
MARSSGARVSCRWISGARRRSIQAIAAVLVLAGIACDQRGAAREPSPGTATAGVSPAGGPAAPARRDAPTRDLSVDESMGGHTLARHVGKTDDELAERLRREPQITSASSYTDRMTAERAVTAALDSAGRKLDSWVTRHGRRPNLVLNYVERSGPPLGRSLGRGRSGAVPCRRALVVLRWDDRRERFYALTSYPEADR